MARKAWAMNNTDTIVTITETIFGSARPKKYWPSNAFVTIHIASLLIRMVDTKNMWPHMNRPSSSPVALCARSIRAGQWLLRGRSARPTPAITSLLLLTPSSPVPPWGPKPDTRTPIKGGQASPQTWATPSPTAPAYRLGNSLTRGYHFQFGDTYFTEGGRRVL